MGDLTKNFSRWEFACKCGCCFDDISIPLVHRLQVIRDITGVPMIITSGCRCKKHNATKEVGGKPDSFHLKGQAADWKFDIIGDMLDFRICMLLRNWSGGFHYYQSKGVFHCDIGPKRRW